MKYAFTSEGGYDAANNTLKAQQVINPAIVYHAVNCFDKTSAKFLMLSGEGVKIVYVMTAEDKHGIIVKFLTSARKKLPAS